MKQLVNRPIIKEKKPESPSRIKLIRTLSVARTHSPSRRIQKVVRANTPSARTPLKDDSKLFFINF